MIQSIILTRSKVVVKRMYLMCFSVFLFVFSAGTFRGVCKDIDHFAEDGDYEQDAAEYLLRG